MSSPILYMDNSTAKSMSRCSTEAYLQYFQGYQSREARAALHSGSAGHAALAVWFRTWDADAALDAFENGDGHGSVAYRSWADAHEVLPDDRLHPNNCLKVLTRYFELHPASALPFVIDPDFVEIGFAYPITDDLVVVGKMDGLVRDRESHHLYVLENKFTRDISPMWLRQFKVDSQLSTYLWAARQHVGTERVVGTIVNGLELSRLPSDPGRKCKGSPQRGIEAHGVPYSECGHLHAHFRLAMATRTDAQIEAWRRTFIGTAARYRRLRAAYPTLDHLEFVPQEGTFHNACTFCGFYDFCSTGRQSMMLDTMLVHDPWSPYAHAFGPKAVAP